MTTSHAQPTEDQRPSPPSSPPPAKGPSLWTVLTVALALAAGLALGAYFTRRAAPSAHAAASQTTGATHDHAQDVPEESAFYTCGMHPWVILPQPGICPICRMTLTPLDPDKFTGEVAIDPVITQNIGVRVAPVASGPVTRTIRTVGSVTYDETRVRDVNIKVEGWIERVHVGYEGAPVGQGDPLFDLYSPRLYAAQEEFLAAMRTPAPTGDARTLAADARTQLLFYDVTPEQIDDLAQRAEPVKAMTIRSPHAGVVIAKHANEGMRVEPGMRVYQVADLSAVWVMVSLYEYQLPFVQEGQRAVMTLPYVPGQEFEGRVLYVYPYLDDATRQLRVRLQFDNPTGLLKPGMYANIELSSTLASERALAPRSAIIDTGERTIAFVSLGGGRFEPRDVRVGVETDGGNVEILDGLRAGEMVVTSGQFLLDSEARLRESLAKMIRGQMAVESTPSAPAGAQASALRPMPAPMSEALAALLTAYFTIGDTLASDSFEGIADDARIVASQVDALLMIPLPGDEHFWHRHDEAATIRGEALALINASDIAAARLRFANLSIALSTLLASVGAPPGLNAPVEELHCPMYREGQGGGVWLQPAGSVRNPFFGAVMLQCFDRRAAVPVAPQEGGAP